MNVFDLSSYQNKLQVCCQREPSLKSAEFLWLDIEPGAEKKLCGDGGNGIKLGDKHASIPPHS